MLFYLYRPFLSPQSLIRTLKSFLFTAWTIKLFVKIMCYFKFKESIVCGFLLPVTCNGWIIVSSSLIWDQRAFCSLTFLWNPSTNNILKAQNYVYQMLWKTEFLLTMLWNRTVRLLVCILIFGDSYYVIRLSVQFFKKWIEYGKKDFLVLQKYYDLETYLFNSYMFSQSIMEIFTCIHYWF